MVQNHRKRANNTTYLSTSYGTRKMPLQTIFVNLCVRVTKNKCTRVLQLVRAGFQVVHASFASYKCERVLFGTSQTPYWFHEINYEMSIDCILTILSTIKEAHTIHKFKEQVFPYNCTYFVVVDVLITVEERHL